MTVGGAGGQRELRDGNGVGGGWNQDGLRGLLLLHTASGELHVVGGLYGVRETMSEVV